ncbi:MAG TPA: hypothetical protein VL283_03770 [Candidatus Baltobacteraceae bacterium]|nr:hypothetical protein [Candidatus Baltobacteraceae bacterium]
MDQPAPKPSYKKPIGGFIVVLVTALVVGGWLYVDMVRNEIEQKVDILSSELDAAKKAERADAAGGQAPPPVEVMKMQTYAAALGEERFQIDLPEGWHLSVAADADVAYVVMDPTAENGTPTPDMVIRLVDPEKEPYASALDRHESGTRLVMTADGKAAFWITGWEDQEWPAFEKVAASFKAL